MNTHFSPEAALKWVMAAALASWMHIPAAVVTLLILMAFDMVTGWLAAFVTRNLSSMIGWRGLTKKLLTLVLLGVLHVAEARLGFEFGLEKVVAIGYAINELLSIIENCARAGVPIPAAVIEALATVKRLRTASPAAIEKLKES